MTVRWTVRATEPTAVFSPQLKYKTVGSSPASATKIGNRKRYRFEKTQKPQRFLGFFLPFFKVKFKRYHFSKTTFGEDLN